MKNLKSISVIATSIAVSSSLAFAEPVELSSDLNLVGFSGGSCNISVIPNANATSLNLDDIVSFLDVATVETQCDYGYRVTVSGDSTFGDFVLTNSTDSFAVVPYAAFVDGLPVFGSDGETEVGFFGPGDNRTMPVAIDTFQIAPVPGIYEGSLTFSIVID